MMPGPACSNVQSQDVHYRMSVGSGGVRVQAWGFNWCLWVLLFTQHVLHTYRGSGAVLEVIGPQRADLALGGVDV